MTSRRKTPSRVGSFRQRQKRKEAREARAADPYAYQRSQERKERKEKRDKASIGAFVDRFVAPMYTHHNKNKIETARARLYHHVDTYKEYLDRDRDILLLAMFSMVETILSRT